MASDAIKSLPLDDHPLSKEEIMTLNSLPAIEKAENKLLSYLKPFLITVVLFIVFSLPILDKVMVSLVPSLTHLEYIRILLKALMFAALMTVLFFFKK